jgi:hypothetical protein
MSDVYVVLGYPWMDLVGIVNINVQKMFLKLWYKKMKIALQNISLIKHEVPKEAHDEVLAGKQIAVPHDTSNEDFKVELEEDPKEAIGENPKEEHKQEDEVEEMHVEESKCNIPIFNPQTSDVYC